MTEFLKLYIKRKELILELMGFFQERIYNYLKHLLQGGAVTLYRICGPEYATPPYLNPREFDRLVTSYDAELVDLLHRYSGYARLHSHGKVKRVLNSIKEMKVDAIDPLEPPPAVLIGNIEERLLEIGDKENIEKQVKKAINEGASEGGFILCPTAMPLTTPLRKKIQENIIHYIDCGLKHGRLCSLNISC